MATETAKPEQQTNNVTPFRTGDGLQLNGLISSYELVQGTNKKNEAFRFEKAMITNGNQTWGWSRFLRGTEQPVPLHFGQRVLVDVDRASQKGDVLVVMGPLTLQDKAS